MSLMNCKKKLNECLLVIQFTGLLIGGGFLIRPEVIEFWKGRQSRMHDRIAYYKTEDGWSINRLAP